MRALPRKLLRDLWHLKGPAFAIAAVVAAAIGILVGMISMYGSLQGSLVDYYEGNRFADAFASLKRAPDSVARELARVPGVTLLEARVSTQVVLDVRGLDEPAAGHIISLPDEGRPLLNDVYLRAGRLPEPGRADEALAGEAFARANHIALDDEIGAVINGRWQRLRIVGVALSPEFIYSIRPGDLFPDERRFGVLWMRRRALAAAADMKDAFNDVVAQLAPGAREADVLAAIDRVLARWGGIGAYGRDRHLSARFLENELMQLRASGITIPLIFLAVAAFLIHVVLGRIIGSQRAQIATLKAFGYSSAEIAWHYLQFTLLVAFAGDLVGLAIGVWMGRGMAVIYTEFFHFPELSFALSRGAVVTALVVSAGAALLGGAQAVLRVARLPPAAAMQPEAPPVFHRSGLDRLLSWLRLDRLLPPPARMILRNLQRRPVRAVLSIVAMAFAGSLVVLGSGQEDAIEHVIAVEFSRAQRDDVMVSFIEPRSAGARHEVERLPGVLSVEPFRAVAATLRSGPRSEDVALFGRVAKARLRRVVDERMQVVEPPPTGIALSRVLARKLGLRLGDAVEAQLREGRRRRFELAVVELIDDMIGSAVYLDIDELRRLLDEGQVSSGAFLAVDHNALGALYPRLKRMPGVAGVAIKETTLASMRGTMAKNLEQSRVMIVLFSLVITFGVVYNAARIALAERSRELASLRVLGMTRGEISIILLGELALLTLAAIPLAWLLGYGMGALVFSSMATDYFRIPMVMLPRTFAYSATVMILSAAASAAVVRRRLDRLDLVEVLKTRE